jgi:glutamine synthetase
VVEQMHPEYAEGQIEIALAPATPVAAVDAYLLTRVVVTRVALAHGMLVSFAPVSVAGEVGNGLHIHFSASRDGSNVFHDPDTDDGLAAAGRHMLAGVVDTLVEATALLGGTTVSFLRLQPHLWAGAFACWGDGNREAAVRLMRGFAGFEARQSNIEIKCADGFSNQYLAVAAIIASALRGVERELPLAPGITVDPASIAESERAAHGVAPLPSDLGAALDAFEASEFFRALLGDVLFDTYVAVRRHDQSVCAGLSDDPAALVAANRWRQ